MGELTITQIVDGIKDTLATATGIVRSQSGEELTEGIADFPLLQVYWEDETTDAQSQNNQTTFGGKVQQSQMTMHADVYTRQRSHIGEDIASCQTLADEVRKRLAAQKKPPFFGLEGLKSFRWRAQRVEFVYANVAYTGIRFYIEVRVY